jgi:hypothetical protein
MIDQNRLRLLESAIECVIDAYANCGSLDQDRNRLNLTLDTLAMCHIGNRCKQFNDAVQEELQDPNSETTYVHQLKQKLDLENNAVCRVLQILRAFQLENPAMEDDGDDPNTRH